MKGIFVNCPGCKKMLFKNAYLRPGSFLSTKCFYCGSSLTLDSQPGKINIKIVGKVVDNSLDDDLADDEEDGIVVLSL